MFSPKERRQKRDIIALYNYLIWGCSEDRSTVLEAQCGRRRENGHELEHEKFWLNIRKKCFGHEVGPALEQGPRDAVALLFFSVCALLQVPLRKAIALTTAGCFWPPSPLRVRCFLLCHVTTHTQSTWCGMYLMAKCLSWGAACCNHRHSVPHSLTHRSTCTVMRKGINGLSAQYVQKYPTPIPTLSQEQYEHGQEQYTHWSHWAFDQTDPTWNEDGSLICSCFLLDASALLLTPPCLSGQTSFCLRRLAASHT